MDDEIISIGTIMARSDDIGNQLPQEIRKEVFATIKSIGMNEKSAASQISFHAEYKAEVFRFDYEGQKFVEFNGKRLEIYRTYESGDRVELYLGERSGVHV